MWRHRGQSRGVIRAMQVYSPGIGLDLYPRLSAYARGSKLGPAYILGQNPFSETTSIRMLRAV